MAQTLAQHGAAATMRNAKEAARIAMEAKLVARTAAK